MLTQPNLFQKPKLASFQKKGVDLFQQRFYSPLVCPVKAISNSVFLCNIVGFYDWVFIEVIRNLARGLLRRLPKVTIRRKMIIAGVSASAHTPVAMLLLVTRLDHSCWRRGVKMLRTHDNHVMTVPTYNCVSDWCHWQEEGVIKSAYDMRAYRQISQASRSIWVRR